VKAARVAISATPGAEEILRRDWVKAARFYGRFGITEELFRQGVPSEEAKVGTDLESRIPSAMDWVTEAKERAAAMLPRSGETCLSLSD
jgi:hypothetical protein